VEPDHDQTDLSQQPAKTVPEEGATQTEVSGAVGPEKVVLMLDVNFNVYPLDIASGFGHVDLVFIARIGDDGQYLGREFDRAAVGVL